VTEKEDLQHRLILKRIARRSMTERGLEPDLSSGAMAQLDGITGPAAIYGEYVCDMRNIPWCSIDDDDSFDLDQLTYAEKLSDGSIKAYVAVSDVDGTVKKDSPLDEHAHHNTTSVYTVAETFPMLPEKLSEDITSLKYQSDRPAVVIEMLFTGEGQLADPAIYCAMVHNHAKLSYNGVAGWLDNGGSAPQAVDEVNGLEESLKVQDELALKLRTLRHMNGALDLETIEVKPVFGGEELKDLQVDGKNRAKDLIEDFMIAANGVTARYLESAGFPSFRRVVHEPKRWNRIAALAAERGFALPGEPDARALEKFLVWARDADPVRFPDLSNSVVKLLGPGEYAVQIPGQDIGGHFGLAVKDYTHSTAPNRRYSDLVTQRLIKAALAGSPAPYEIHELEALVKQCTRQEDAAKKVERQVIKSAAAILLESRIGEQFAAIVTGAADKGTWVRLFEPPVEGRLLQGFEGLDVGQRLRVELVCADVESGFIDFKTVKT
jgi:VacB/RNase II family 3'-5' exoribonuclease